VCALTLGEPRTNQVLADGTGVWTATITLRNDTRREFVLRFDAIDLRDVDRVIAIGRVHLGQEVVMRTLEVRYDPAAGEHRNGQTIVSIRSAAGMSVSGTEPFVVRRCSPEDGEELASLICGTRASLHVNLSGNHQVLPSNWSWSLNGSGTEFVAESQTLSPGQSGAVVVEGSRIGASPVQEWPRPVIALCPRVESVSPK